MNLDEEPSEADDSSDTTSDALASPDEADAPPPPVTPAVRPSSSPPRSPLPRLVPVSRERPATGWRRVFGSLGNRDFRNLWLGMIATMGGFQMGMVTMGYLVYDLTSSPSKLGIVNAGESVPMLALALFGGALADRIERKRVIQIGQALFGAVAFGVAVSIVTDSVTWLHLLGATIVYGAIFSFLMPARHAMVPELIGKEQLTNAIALNAAGMSVTMLTAPAIAGVLYAVIGPDGIYFLIGAMAVISVLLTGQVPSPPRRVVEAGADVFRDIKEGLVHIRNNDVVRVLLLITLVTTLLAMPFRFLLPVFVVDVYHRGPESLGLLLSMSGLGSLIGALFIAGLGRWRRGLLSILAAALSGIVLLLVVLFPAYAVAIVLMVVLGLGDAGRRTLNQSLIIEQAGDRYRGRVMSVFMMNFGLMHLGVLPAGVAIELFGGRIVIGAMAVVLLAVSALVLLTQRRLRRLV